jgi:putative acetyltransferase
MPDNPRIVQSELVKQITVSVDISPAHAHDPAVRALCAEQTEMLRARYPADAEAPMPVDPSVTFLLARIDGESVGCACLQPITDGIAEARRVFVLPGQRGQDVARLMLTAVEALAIQRGFTILRLETGDLQPESIGLFQATGFRRVPAFPPYLGAPRSICFEKHLHHRALRRTRARITALTRVNG